MDPQLWVQALSYFAGKEENCRQHITEVLTHIEKHNLLPPLLVVQTLAHNSMATLAVVKVTLPVQALWGKDFGYLYFAGTAKFASVIME